MKKLNKKGFTLVELLAVIVILALLMVVATRTIGSSLTNSKRNALQSEVQKVITKVYEEAKTQTLTGELDSESKFSNGEFDDANKIVTVTEGDYTVYVKLSSVTDEVKISEICGQGSGYGIATNINGDSPTLSFPDDLFSTKKVGENTSVADLTGIKSGSSCEKSNATLTLQK